MAGRLPISRRGYRRPWLRIEMKSPTMSEVFVSKKSPTAVWYTLKNLKDADVRDIFVLALCHLYLVGDLKKEAAGTSLVPEITKLERAILRGSVEDAVFVLKHLGDVSPGDRSEERSDDELVIVSIFDAVWRWLVQDSSVDPCAAQQEVFSGTENARSGRLLAPKVSGKLKAEWDTPKSVGPNILAAGDFLLLLTGGHFDRAWITDLVPTDPHAPDEIRVAADKVSEQR